MDQTPPQPATAARPQAAQLPPRTSLSLKDLSERTGLSISYLSEIETAAKYPKIEKLLVLGTSLGVGYDDLVSLRTDERLGPIGEL